MLHGFLHEFFRVLQDRTEIENNFSQAHSEIEIPECICDGDVMDSFSNTEEELLDCELVIRCLFT